jgi:GNAT superfamily N-acetyltransferase
VAFSVSRQHVLRIGLLNEIDRVSLDWPLVVEDSVMSIVRRCRDDEHASIVGIVNAAAQVYRDVIPADRWHEPYMTSAELDAELGAGVVFWGYEREGALVGVMGLQPVRDVELIRHAYVLPGQQRQGIGAALLEYLRSKSARQMLVGTWAAADWAIGFYRRHGFELVSLERKTALLKSYWSIPERQIETSVVLASPPFGERDACPGP